MAEEFQTKKSPKNARKSSIEIRWILGLKQSRQMLAKRFYTYTAHKKESIQNPSNRGYDAKKVY